jgi:hypothetical protein
MSKQIADGKRNFYSRRQYFSFSLPSGVAKRDRRTACNSFPILLQTKQNLLEQFPNNFLKYPPVAHLNFVKVLKMSFTSSRDYVPLKWQKKIANSS